MNSEAQTLIFLTFLAVFGIPIAGWAIWSLDPCSEIMPGENPADIHQKMSVSRSYLRWTLWITVVVVSASMLYIVTKH